jgi:hypothetical protein
MSSPLVVDLHCNTIIVTLLGILNIAAEKALVRHDVDPELPGTTAACWPEQ